MTDLDHLNDPVLKRRVLEYFPSRRFKRRFARVAGAVRSGNAPDTHEFFRRLGCTPGELSVWLTLVDTAKILNGQRPVHGLPALQGKRNLTVDVKVNRQGEIADYRFLPSQISATSAPARSPALQLA